MDPTSFVDHAMGRPIKTPGRNGFYAYHPAPLPRSLPLDEPTVKMLSDADNALGRLAGAGRLLRNPHLLVTPYILKEAVASSRIEGPQASISDVFDASAIGGEASEYRGRLAGSRSRAHEIIDVMFENPYLTVRGVMNRLGVTQPGAANLVKQLESVGILSSMEPAKFGRRRWVAHGILDVIG